MLVEDTMVAWTSVGTAGTVGRDREDLGYDRHIHVQVGT